MPVGCHQPAGSTGHMALQRSRATQTACPPLLAACIGAAAASCGRLTLLLWSHRFSITWRAESCRRRKLSLESCPLWCIGSLLKTSFTRLTGRDWSFDQQTEITVRQWKKGLHALSLFFCSFPTTN